MSDDITAGQRAAFAVEDGGTRADAELHGVPYPSVKLARVIRDRSPATFAELRAGKIGVTKAHKMAQRSSELGAELVIPGRGGGLSLPGSQTTVSLTLPDGLSFDEWAAVGETLATVGQSYLWWLGDWWAYGEHRYGDRADLVNRLRAEGRKFPAFQTCMDCGWLARSFETSRRREVLSFSHHREVAALPQPVADRLLALAEERDLSRAELRDLAAEARKAEEEAAAAAEREDAGDEPPAGTKAKPKKKRKTKAKGGPAADDPPPKASDRIPPGTRLATMLRFAEHAMEFGPAEVAADAAGDPFLCQRTRRDVVALAKWLEDLAVEMEEVIRAKAA